MKYDRDPNKITKTPCTDMYALLFEDTMNMDIFSLSYFRASILLRHCHTTKFCVVNRIYFVITIF